jgi:hypothetical protein
MREPNRDFGILPFWFLNGELDPEEMRWQLSELSNKGMHGVVFHGRYGLEMPYLGPRYLDRIKSGVEEANRLGLAAWIYDEMNWPSGTADKRVLKARPDLAQRYLECVSFTIRGPWFMCLTGEDSRYLDFERSTPVAMFAIGEGGEVLDLTSNLSFEKVVPWEVPPGEWRLCYLVEKRADYYIDALDPEATATFLKIGYEPYIDALSNGHEDAATKLVGFYSDEPAMHYYLTAGDNPIVPWTKDMFRRFRDRNGYELRSRLLDLFFDLRPEAARTRHDFYNTTTEFYSNAYYGQIHEWCRKKNVLFTAHLLYEEWIRQMVRVEGNPFRHYEHMDVVAVDHLYPVIGTREAPDQHVAMKLASSAAHHLGSDRLICESFGGIFMDATMQRMKWVTDWEYVLGVNVLNPHGFHYTFEGARKRDWPPSMFYQYPWWKHYGEFSAYASRLSELLTGGRHVAKVAMLWPINAMFATYLPQQQTPDGHSIEAGLNVLTDLLLRLHHDFDYIDEDILATADIRDGRLLVSDEDYELLLVPPMAYLRSTTVDVLERFVAAGGRVLGVIQAPHSALTTDGIVDVSARVESVLGSSGDAVDDKEFEVVRRRHGAGAAAFVHGDRATLSGPPGVERDLFSAALDEAIRWLIQPDVELSNPDLFVLHRRRDDSDLYFIVNTTFDSQRAEFRLQGDAPTALFDPSSGDVSTSSAWSDGGFTTVDLVLPPAGSIFVVSGRAAARTDGGDGGSGPAGATAGGWGTEDGIAGGNAIELGGPWTFDAEDDNALVIQGWRATPENAGDDPILYADPDIDDARWDPVVAGAWAYQLPAEPGEEWPIPVWYRIPFEVGDIPNKISLLVDGFNGDKATVWLNGRRVSAAPVRSRIDSQMKEMDLRGLVSAGRNLLAVRLILPDPTSGLVDHVKLLGEFKLEGGPESGYRIVATTKDASPAPWTKQGYPFLSGSGAYQTVFDLPEADAGRHLVLDIPMFDDVAEIEVNDKRAGVRLWDPYQIDITELARPGSNKLVIRIANTPANLLNGHARPSGLNGAPRVLVDPVPQHGVLAAATSPEVTTT